ncbi:hypothetical protein HY029_00680 [Candidatus Gottesmanbacteria bacterium]|nr:hypothetical protein [Candidatus Gottesmanbacteria bacterium]
MKKIIFIVIIFAVLILNSSIVQAITSTPTPSDSPTPTITTFIDKLKQIEILKEKIATKVAEIRQTEKSGLNGTIKSVADTSITLTTKSTDQVISYSEDTIFFKMTDGVKSEPLDYKQAKKLKSGDQLAILGYFDSSHSTFSAKYVYMTVTPLHLIGKIADMDKTNYTITVNEPKGNTLVDIETYTKIYSFTKKAGLVKSGFSKLKENDVVHIFATTNPKEETRASASKIVSLAFGEMVSTPSATPMVKIKDASPSAASKNK